MKALDRKLLRDLRALGGQILTIALVVASGVAGFTTVRSAYGSLDRARRDFYAAQRFPDVFARCERAPRSVLARLEQVPGVAVVEGRVTDQASLPLPWMTEPASAQVVGLPPGGARLSALHLRAGRLPRPEADDEALLSDAFADAHGLGPGDTLPMILGGVFRELRVVGVGLSPEHVLVASPGDIAVDNRRRGIVFMNEGAVAAATGRVGAFDSVVAQLSAGASEAGVRAAFDRVLAPYGAFGAHGRDRQLSHFILSGELAQLENMATQIPPLFLLVAAFLLHVVLTRLVQLQRSQIAALKALGYGDLAIGVHYLKLAGVIVALGAAAGLGLGQWLGGAMVELYRGYFRFPTLVARLDVPTALGAVAVSALAATVGTFTSVRSVLRLAPAEAMRPPAPARYRRGLTDLPGVRRFVPAALQMTLRELQRRPLRLVLSSLGIAASVALLVLGQFFGDAMGWLTDTYMERQQRWDVQVTLREARDVGGLATFRQLPGVTRAEGMRHVPARVRVGPREREVALQAMVPDQGAEGLQRIVGARGNVVVPPAEGLLVTSKLAEVLGVRPGDALTVEILEGARQTLRLPLAATVEEPFGLQVYARSDALHAALGQEPMVTSVLLQVDGLDSGADDAAARNLDQRLARMRDVLGFVHRDRMIQEFRAQSAKNIGVFSLVLTLFAATIAIGVVYNNARVSLSMRRRDLASLRVLGFTRAEISEILLSEIALQVLLALPLGLAFGDAMVASMATGVADPEVYRLPVIVSTRSYAFAAGVTLAAAAFIALLVRRKLDRLDLIAVLKTRE
ncbi:MAG: ABC transporter permease [Myxococcota bacterium]